MFTPADVVRRYRETGITPVFGVLGVTKKDGKWQKDPYSKGCCALGVMLIDQPVLTDDVDDDDAVVRKQLDVQDYVAFYDGFDNNGGLYYGSSALTQLGKACRDAVLEAGFTPITE